MRSGNRSHIDPRPLRHRDRVLLCLAAITAGLLWVGWARPACASSGLHFQVQAIVSDPNNYLILDDAEDGDQINLLGGLWSSYDDSTNGGTSVVHPNPFLVVTDPGQGALGSNHYVQLSGTVTTAYAYGFIGLTTTLNNAGTTVDLHEYSGIRLYVKGDGKTYRFMVKSGNVTDYDYYGYTFPTTGSWQELKLAWPLLTQAGFGAVQDRDQALTTAQGFEFQTVGQPLSSVDLRVDAPTLLVVDDCEDGDTVNLLGGTWYVYKDASSTVTPNPFVMTVSPGAGAYGSNGFAAITGAVASSGYVGMGTGLNAAGTDVDLSGYYGLYLCVKGDGKPYRLQIKSSNIADSDYFGTSVTATSAWSKVILPFSTFFQQGFGAPKTLAASLQHARDLQCAAVGAPLSSIAVQLDNYQNPKNQLFLKVSGRNLVNGSGQTVTLRGLGAANGVYDLKTVQQLTGNYYYRLVGSDYAAMKAMGAKVVRFYLQYYWLQDEASRIALFNYLDEQIGYARQQGMYIILNLHYFGLSSEAGVSEDGYYTGDQFGRGYDLAAFWDKISKRYAHEPTIAGYDLINEPRVRSGWPESALYTLYTQLVQTIRANGDTHVIWIGEALGDAAYKDQADHPFTQLADANLAYAYSFYEPFELTHQAYYSNPWYELGAAYPFLEETGTYNSGYYSNPYYADTNNVWTQYVGTWVHLDVANNRMGISLSAPNLKGEVWWDDLVLERQDYPSHANLVAIPLRNATVKDPKTYVGIPAVPSYLPAGWYFSANWIPNDPADYAANPSNYFRLDTTQTHTADGSGSLYINATNVTWPSSGSVWCKWGTDSGIMPTFLPETGYEYRVSGYFKSRNNTNNWVITVAQESFNYTSVLKDKTWMTGVLANYTNWAQNHSVPISCAEFGITDPSQRDPSFPNSPLYQTQWITDTLQLLNAGTNNWTYHVYRSYNPRGDVFGLFDQGVLDTNLQNVLKTGF